jgi:hypothetical protein
MTLADLAARLTLSEESAVATGAAFGDCELF